MFISDTVLTIIIGLAIGLLVAYKLVRSLFSGFFMPGFSMARPVSVVAGTKVTNQSTPVSFANLIVIIGIGLILWISYQNRNTTNAIPAEEIAFIQKQKYNISPSKEAVHSMGISDTRAFEAEESQSKQLSASTDKEEKREEILVTEESYFIQLHSINNEAAALDQVDKLSENYESIFIATLRNENAEVPTYKVLIGPFAKRAEANIFILNNKTIPPKSWIRQAKDFENMFTKLPKFSKH